MSEEVQVLEFELGEDRYCIEIETVTEVIKRDIDEVTPVPNAPSHVIGVIDLRGKTTEIVDPRQLFGHANRDDSREEQHVIVFDDTIDEAKQMGWSVDEVDRVSRISLDNVEKSEEDESVNGIVNREDDFLIWTSPQIAIA